MLIIRTSGEARLSGFLLWQGAHSELYFTDVYWPAFRELDFLRALRSYQQRHRLFGALKRVLSGSAARPPLAIRVLSSARLNGESELQLVQCGPLLGPGLGSRLQRVEKLPLLLEAEL